MIDPATPLPPEALQNIKEQLGLNKPLPVRYAIWLRQLAKGNLGFSFASRRAVSQVILDACRQHCS